MVDWGKDVVGTAVAEVETVDVCCVSVKCALGFDTHERIQSLRCIDVDSSPRICSQEKWSAKSMPGLVYYCTGCKRGLVQVLKDQLGDLSGECSETTRRRNSGYSGHGALL